MAEQAELEDDIAPILTDDEPPADDPPEDPPADLDDPPADDPPADEDEEVEVIFGDEAAPASRGEDSGLVKDLRKRNRQLVEENRSLRTGPASEPQKIEVGDKPTLDACEYDEAKFEQELDAWKERKRQADELEAADQRQVQAQTARFTEKVSGFERDKKALGAKDFDVAGTAVAEALSATQAMVVLKVADNSAAVIYALGRHPQKLATLAATDDLIEFAAAVARIEGTLKVTKRTRTPPEPDRPQRGSGQLSQTSDKELERLEAEADRTGDRTKVVAHKRKLKAQGRS